VHPNPLNTCSSVRNESGFTVGLESVKAPAWTIVEARQRKKINEIFDFNMVKILSWRVKRKGVDAADQPRCIL
jgi:hypothetical protein